jgi:hypothetical protein
MGLMALFLALADELAGIFAFEDILPHGHRERCHGDVEQDWLIR